jgi:hypothetical protein
MQESAAAAAYADADADGAAAPGAHGEQAHEVQRITPLEGAELQALVTVLDGAPDDQQRAGCAGWAVRPLPAAQWQAAAKRAGDNAGGVWRQCIMLCAHAARCHVLVHCGHLLKLVVLRMQRTRAWMAGRRAAVYMCAWQPFFCGHAA